MKRTSKIKWGEIRIGLLIAAAILVLMWASFSGGGTSVFHAKTSYRAYFANVNGLVRGSPVWIAGIEVGNVTSIEFVNLDSARQIEVKFKVLNSVTNMITTDASVKLGTIGFIGDKYIEVIPGTLTNPQLEPGSFLATAPSGNLDEVFAKSGSAVDDASELMNNLSEITARLKEGEGSFGKMFTESEIYDKLTRLIASLTVLVGDLQKNQARLITSIDNISADLADILVKVNTNEGTLGKIIADPALYNNLQSSSTHIDSILYKINRGDGTAGALVNDDELYEEVKNLVVRIENLVADIEKNPRKYFKFSVF